MKSSLKRPVIIGLIGGVASGKSFVAELFEAEGALRIDADKLGHEVLRTEEVRNQLKALWGASVLKDSGEVDRAALGKLVFGSSHEALERREQLEAIVHPLIRQLAESQIEHARELSPSPVALLVDAPLLLEAGWEPMCDLILFIDSPIEQRLARAKLRGWSEEHFAEREASQISLDEKRQRATHVIDNGASDNVALRVKHLWQQLVANSA